MYCLNQSKIFRWKTLKANCSILSLTVILGNYILHTTRGKKAQLKLEMKYVIHPDFLRNSYFYYVLSTRHLYFFENLYFRRRNFKLVNSDRNRPLYYIKWKLIMYVAPINTMLIQLRWHTSDPAKFLKLAELSPPYVFLAKAHFNCCSLLSRRHRLDTTPQLNNRLK